MCESGGKPLFLTCSYFRFLTLPGINKLTIEQVRKRGLPPLSHIQFLLDEYTFG
jgi:hypothetical protein